MAKGSRDATPSVVSATGIIAAAPIHIELPGFSGSLPVLFACVREGKLDLLGVPLLPICESYFAYLARRDEVDLDEAAAALAVLAWLLERKAWLLLPIEEEPEDAEPPAELPESSAYEFAPAIEALQLWEGERARLFFRTAESGPEPFELPLDLGDVTAGDLARALERVLLRAHPESDLPTLPPRRSLSEQMAIVLRALPDDWSSLETLVPESCTRTDVVYWFLALLELIRLGQAAIRLYDGDVQFARARSGPA